MYSAQQMRENILVEKVKQELAKNSTQKLKVMTVEVPIDCNSSKWTNKMAEIGPIRIESLRFNPKQIDDSPPSPPIPELLNVEQVQQQQQQGLDEVEVDEIGDAPDLV